MLTQTRKRIMGKIIIVIQFVSDISLFKLLNFNCRKVNKYDGSNLEPLLEKINVIR